MAQDAYGKFCETHKMAYSREYAAWANMLYRCKNPNAAQYSRYGGRGIQVCSSWEKFENFIKDMGMRPSEHHSLDRIDVNGDYRPENCRWADLKTQNRNRRNTRHYFYKGETLSLPDLIEKYNLPKDRTLNRIRRGWDISEAIEHPNKPKFGRSECSL